MADYAATVTNDLPRPERLTQNLGIIIGSVDITNYNSTLAEITGITGHFKSTPRVICDGVSSNGYVVKWNKSSGSFECYEPTNASNHTHNAIQVLNSQSGGDQTNFVEINDGSGSALSATAHISAAGSGSDFYVPTDGAGSETGSGSEAPNDTTIGTVNFVAIGLI